MDDVRYHLAEAVALNRPELPKGEQLRMVEHLLQLIGNPERGANPSETIATRGAGDSESPRQHTENNELETGALGFVISSERDGTIKEIIQGGLELGPRFAPGARLAALVAPYHSRKARRFLRDISEAHASYDCLLSVLQPSGIVRLYWSGVSLESGLIVVGTKVPLSNSIPGDLEHLAKKRPDSIKPLLRGLAARRRRNSSSPHLGPDDHLRARASEPGSENRADYGRLPGRRRLLELAAHDLNNPISGILTASEYLIEDAGRVLEPHQARFLRSIAASSRTALKLIQDMVEISHVRVVSPTLELQPTDIVLVVQQQVSSVRPLSDAMKVAVDLKTRKQVPIFRGDPVRLAEAFHGLMVNAFGSSPTGGKIEIEIGGSANEINVAMHRMFPAPAGGPSELSNGPGDRKTPRKLSDVHAALLLAQAQRIVIAHGGVLRVHSQGNKARSWTVTLPFMAAHARSG